MLSRIQFTNFRGFRKLALDGLQRVNLIVGKNNSGKTSLLEGCAALLNSSEAPKEFSKLRQLEQGLQAQFQKSKYADWVVHEAAADKTAELSGVWTGKELNVFLAPIPPQPDVVFPQTERPSATSGGRKPPQIKQDKLFSICVVSALHIRPENLVQSLGNAVSRRDGEELLESALRSVDPRIKKVRIVPIQNKTQVVIDIGLSRLVPISQVGQGTYRLVEMFSEIIGADAQVAFVDELENGIHHTCLTDVWNGIAEAAQLFNVQVFATTHSHECIEAAHAAFLSRPEYDFGIIQLFREAGEIQGRVLHQQHIAAAISGDIDLRA